MAIKVIKVLEDVLGANTELAKKNQARLDEHGILTINIMASPGAGKTSLIMQTIKNLKAEINIAVIEGDVASSLDAETVNAQGIPAVQINTAGGCHLDANMIAKAMDELSLENIDLMFIENVGNLICPAEFDLGEHKRVMILSLPEGDDKPHKYPLMFSEADVIILNKHDLLPLLDFDMPAFRKVIAGLNPKAKIFPVSCKTGEGIEAWLDWIRGEIKKANQRLP